MKEVNKKDLKSLNGFKCRLAQAIIFTVIAAVFVIVTVVFLAELANVKGAESEYGYEDEFGEGWFYGFMSAIFGGLGAVFVFFAVMQFICAFLGRKKISANNFSIAISCWFPYFGLPGVIGGVMGNSALRLKTVNPAELIELAQSISKAEMQHKQEKEQSVGNLNAAEKSVFTGGAFANYFISLGTALLSVITLGIAYPFMACLKLKWMKQHTFINGRQMTFDGNGLQFFGRYMLMWLLSIITFGIYYALFMKVAVEKWQTSHTHFIDTVTEEGVLVGEEKVKPESVFDGHWWQLLGVNWLCNFVTIITLTFGQYWAHCYRERWYCKHRKIDGISLAFDGRAGQYFGVRVKWILLTVITFGIYGFWLKVKSEQWTVSHTHITTK